MLRVLSYHRISDAAENGDLSPRLLSATPEEFERQVRYVTECFDVVSMTDVLESVNSRSRLPNRALLITFDDGYRDFGEIAWPILKTYGAATTLFVPTGFPGVEAAEFWWDRLCRAIVRTKRMSIDTPFGELALQTDEERLAAVVRIQSIIKSLEHQDAMSLIEVISRAASIEPLKATSVLNWDELRSLAGEGVTIGSHTRTHPLLTRIPAEQVQCEIRSAHADIEREIGVSLPILCYPGGAHSDCIVQIAAEEGTLLAFTTLDGHNDLRRSNLLRLRRTDVTTRTTLPVLKLRLLKAFTYVDMWRHRANAAAA